MNIQEQIIALLQGDLKDEVQLTELFRQLAGSSESRHLLLDHIELGQQVDSFVGSLMPATSAKAGLWNRIDSFEGGGSVSTQVSNNERGDKSGIGQHLWVGILLALLAGFGFGYWFGEGKITADHVAVDHSVGLDSIPSIKDLNAENLSTDQAVPHRASDTFTPAMRGEALSPSGPVSVFRSIVPIVENPAQATPVPPAQDGQQTMASLQVFAPNGGERFKAGSTIPVMWSGNLENPLPTFLEYSTDGGASWGEIGPVHEKDGGQQLWRIPDNIASAEQCLTRIVVEDSLGLDPTYERTFLGHDNGVCVAEISPDGRWLATVGSDTKVLLWNLRTGELVHTMVGHTGYVTFAKFSHDGRSFASCSQDGTVRIWDVETGKETAVLEGKGEEKNLVWAVAFSPDDRVVAVTNDDGTLTFWDPQSGLELNPAGVEQNLQPHEESMRYIEFTPDGRQLIASSTDQTASIIDLSTGQVVHRFVHHVDDTLSADATRQEKIDARRRRTVNGIQMTRDGKTVITCGYDGLVKFWDVETERLIRSENYHNGEKVSSIALSPDGKWLASVGYDGTTKLVDVASGNVLASISAPLDGQPASMLRASFGQDMRSLAIAHIDGRATLWRLKPIVYSDISDSFWAIEPCGAPPPELK